MRMSSCKQFGRAAVIGAWCVLAAGSVSAHLITSAWGGGNHIISGGAPVPLNNMTSPSFFNAYGERFVVTFSAECAVAAPSGNYYAATDVDIVVLNAAGTVVQTLAPTFGSQDAFCTANGTAGWDGWSRNSISVVGGGFGLPAGNYSVQVRGHVPVPFFAWYGDRALVVSR
jgi:hypothetical protein